MSNSYDSRNKPANFTRRKETSALVEEIETANIVAINSKAGIPAIRTTAGRHGGNFVIKELVYAYAMWISPKFHLKVIRAYDQLKSQPVVSGNPRQLREQRND